MNENDPNKMAPHRDSDDGPDRGESDRDADSPSAGDRDPGGSESEGSATPYALEPHDETRQQSLIEDFEEDADFSEDPEVEAALQGRPAKKAEPPRNRPERPVLARDGWDRPKPLAIVGGVITIPALVASWLSGTRAPDSDAMDGLIATLLALYNTGLHTLTGVAAVLLSGVLLNLTPGRIEVIAARMLAAVAVFQVFVHLDLGYGLSVLLGVLGYLLVLALLMRTTRDRLFVVSAAHLLLVGITQLGMMLYAAADARVGG